jgi:hypothetical protein
MNTENTPASRETNFTVECDTCGKHYLNWSGSTPCCGSITFIVDENGKATKSISLFGSLNGSEIKPVTIDLK